MIEVLALYAIYALEFTFGKAALTFVQPTFLVSTRMLLGGSILLTHVYFFNRSEFRIGRQHWSLLLQAILFAFYVGFVFDYWGLKYMTSSKNALISTLMPFVTAFIAYFLDLEKFTRKKIVGLMIGFIGVIPILLHSKMNEGQYVTTDWFFLPELASIAAVAGVAYGWIILGKLNRDHGYPTTLINGLGMLMGGLLALCTSLLVDTWNPVPFSAFWPFMGYTIMLVIVSNLIIYNWYVALLRKYSATLIAFVSFTIPIYVAFYSWIWLGEVVSTTFLVSVFIVCVGLYVFYQDELHKTKQFKLLR